MKFAKVLSIVLLAAFVYTTADAQSRHKPVYRKHHVMKHPHRRKRH